MHVCGTRRGAAREAYTRAPPRAAGVLSLLHNPLSSLVESPWRSERRDRAHTHPSPDRGPSYGFKG